MNNDQTIQKSRLPWGISWLTLVLALLAIGTFIAISDTSGRYAVPVGMGGGWAEESGGVVTNVSPMSAGAPSAQVRDMMDSSAYYPYPYPNPDVPITDTREFLKIYYNAALRTRDVPALTRRVETTVRGYDGRIDQEQSSLKYGYVSFALPQAKYEAFRAELESLVGKRFITLNISSQNLLSQKVSIEEQQKQADKVLADYKAARQKIVSAHASAVQALQARINAPEITTSDKQLLQQQLANENASYAAQLNNADANIKYAQDWVKGVQTQDATLLANVATVTGTVSIQWISFWDMAQLYLPGYWIPAIFAVLSALSFYRDRARSRKYP